MKKILLTSVLVLLIGVIYGQNVIRRDLWQQKRDTAISRLPYIKVSNILFGDGSIQSTAGGGGISGDTARYFYYTGTGGFPQVIGLRADTNLFGAGVNAFSIQAEANNGILIDGIIDVSFMGGDTSIMLGWFKDDLSRGAGIILRDTSIQMGSIAGDNSGINIGSWDNDDWVNISGQTRIRGDVSDTLFLSVPAIVGDTSSDLKFTSFENDTSASIILIGHTGYGAGYESNIELGVFNDINSSVIALVPACAKIVTDSLDIQAPAITATGDVTVTGDVTWVSDSIAVDSTYSGKTIYLKAAANIGFGKLVYLNTSGNAALADATDDTKVPVYAVALDTINSGSVGLFLLEGMVRHDARFQFASVGGADGLIFASETAGAMTQTAPSTSASMVQIVGIAKSANKFYFKPEYVMVENE